MCERERKRETEEKSIQNRTIHNPVICMKTRRRCRGTCVTNVKQSLYVHKNP